MLDKKVIQFTREGLVRKNLSTGESSVVVQSDYAKEMKYQPAGKEARYQSPYGHTDGKESDNSKFKAKAGRCGSAGKEESGTTILGEISSSSQKGVHTGGHERKDVSYGSMAGISRAMESGQTPPSDRGPARYSYGKRQNNIKYYYTPRTDAGSIPTPAEYRKSVRGRFSAGKRIFHYSKDRIFRNDEEKDDNAGIQAAGTTIRSARRFRSGIRKIRELNQKRKYVLQSVERTAVYQRRAVNAARSASEAAGNVVKTGKTVGKAAKLLKNPAVVKFLLLAAAIFISLLLLCMLLGGLTAGLFGSTTDNPDLTRYVEQLDSDFLAKVDSIKADYEKKSNTTVTIEGDESVATDPNALAIVAVGEWTMVDLTPENKAKLANAHAKLNTFAVSSKDETETKTTTNPDGTSSEAKKTVHHVTIQVRVYTALEKLDDFDYTDQQQKDITEQLTVLNAITTGMPENTGGTGTVVGDGDFIWPLQGHTFISSGYGSRVDPITGKAGAFHTGLDIPAPTGTPVLASAGGKIIYSGVKGGYGNCVIIQHANGVQTLYGHNSELDVQKGETVTQGQVIAKVGQTGRATGPHCHFEFRVNGQHVDPAQYIHFKESS